MLDKRCKNKKHDEEYLDLVQDIDEYIVDSNKTGNKIEERKVAYLDAGDDTDAEKDGTETFDNLVRRITLKLKSTYTEEYEKMPEE